jgi:ATP-dependent Lon protease
MMSDETKIKMSALDEKLTGLVQHLVVRKDLIRKVKGNAVVPSYVLEYLLSQYCTVSDETQIAAGIERVLNILKEHYVHRSEAGLIRSMIREKRRPHKVIDRISVNLNEKSDVYEATFSNLGISKVVVPSETVKLHQKLLTGGVWCLADVSYEHTEGRETPWTLEALKPIQKSSFNFDEYVEARRQFSTDEWIDVLMQSIGLNPEAFSRRKKLIQLTRLVAFCERNYNLMELGSKGTGKSHVFSELSPHGMLISGGEITVPKLFVENRRPYNLGLVGHWSCVAFDEFAGKGKRVDKALVDIMKNYMANKTFSRGVETLGAEASMVFIGNTRHSVAHMLKHSDLFDELPTQYHDPAFLDRLHFYVPGWEVDIVRSELFTSGFGFVIDYFAEILKKQRDDDFSQLFAPHFKLSDDLSTRDRESINKTFSGMMKLVYPHREVTVDEIEELLVWSMEGRKRVKDQLLRIDETFENVTFAYKRLSNNETVHVSTLEESQYPHIYWPERLRGATTVSTPEAAAPAPTPAASSGTSGKPALPAVRKVIRENQTGIDFDSLFGPYLEGAKEITITDTYVRKFHQARNLMEFLETIARLKMDSQDVHVHLIAAPDDIGTAYQEEYFAKIQENVGPIGIIFDWEFRTDLHARHIITDHGWEILLDRGLDVFQPYDMKEAFSPANRLQKFRQCKKFEVTFRRKDT